MMGGPLYPPGTGRQVKVMKDYRKSRENASASPERMIVKGEAIRDWEQAQQAFGESEARYRKLYEQARKEEQLYRSLIHSSADAIVIYDMEGRARYVSPSFSEVFGWSLEELEGRQIPFLPGFEKDRTMAIITDLIENGTPCRGFETRRFTKDGRLLDMSISASRYDDHQGKPAGMLVMLRDISERKRLEAQLRKAQKMEAIGTLAGGVAHDFNNILQVISGYVEILLLNKGKEDPDSEKLGAVARSVDKASDLVRQLLTFSREVESELGMVDLNQEVKQVSGMLERAIPKMVHIELALNPDLEAVSGDPVQIQQIMMNLAVNARDAMPEGGTLSFRTEKVFLDDRYCRIHLGATPGEYALLTIADTGQGMDEEVMEHLFEPFFTTKDTGGGTGLGLATVYGIVENHGGYITCDSRPGAGTTFKIYLPLFKQASMGETGRRDRNLQRGGETILVVEDEPHIRELGEELLQEFGYKVLTSPDGKSALDLYAGKARDIDLVILDLIMPGMGGRRCLEEIIKINPEAKVLIASGHQPMGSTEGILAAAKGFVTKPYKLKQMLGKVREVLDGDDAGPA